MSDDVLNEFSDGLEKTVEEGAKATEEELDEFDPAVSNEDDDEEVGQSGIALGLTPVGTIGINVKDASGVVAGHFIDDPAEAWELAGHLQSLATMIVQSRYAAAFKERQMVEEMMKNHKLYVPGQ